MIQSRDVHTQAIFSLRGKPLNVYGLKRDTVYKNEELYNIMRALGIEDGLEGLRYNKVIIATDADVDGMHIRNLLLTYFLHYFEELVLKGHVYLLETPLFRVRDKNETVYCYSEAGAGRGHGPLDGRRGHAVQGPGRDQPEGVQAVHGRRHAPHRGADPVHGRRAQDAGVPHGQEHAGAEEVHREQPRGRRPAGGMTMSLLKPLMEKNFLEYASYVIMDRAIPDLRDGCKPVQRRILHTLFEMHDGKFHKVANVIGECMKLHPHGDASIGDALVVLANKEYFIEKQGNFGNILTGHAAAASRYTECRLTPLAVETLFNTALTEFIPSYDGRRQEPRELPAKVPVLLMLGRGRNRGGHVHHHPSAQLHRAAGGADRHPARRGVHALPRISSRAG